MKLGIVTYNIAKDWDVPTLIEKCKATGMEAVELRTTHNHGVEPTLSASQRAEVKKRFADSPVRLLSLGSVCEYHAADPAVVRQNIETCKEFVKLAADVGAVGVKVRPNGLQEPAVPRSKTLEQIGKALLECGQFAQDYGIGIWLEVHGRATCEPVNIRAIMDVADHPAVGVCWNSNMPDVVNGSVAPSFELLKRWIRNAHINELCNEAYPWREFFSLLKGIGYQGYCLAEIAESKDPERVLKYYRALWRELAR